MTSQLTASKPLPATKPVTLATAVDGTHQLVSQPAVAIKAGLNPLPSKRPAKIAKTSQKQTFPDDEKTLDGNKLVEGEELVQDGFATASTSLPADSGAAADLGAPAQGAAMNTPSAFASGISSESMLIAQLELPTIPSQSISSGVSASGAAASSSFGSLAGIFGAAAGGGLALGGGGGGRSAGPLPLPELPELDGRLVNGYIAGARVFQDLDGDGVFDSNEPNALTNESGAFTLVGATQNGGSLIAMPTDDTIDKSTGLPVTSWFKAPADAAVISPLSTLVEAGLSEEELKAAFGIDGSVSILDFDPVEAVKGAGSVGAANLALKIKSANVVVSNLMDIGSSLAEGAGASSNSSDVSDMFVSSLVSTIKSNPSSEMNFEDAGLIFDIFDGALDGLGIDADLSEVTTAASARLAESAVALNANATVTDLNDAISKLTSISKIEKVIQDTVAAFVKNAVTNPSSLQELKDIDFATEVASAEVDVGVFETLGFESVESITLTAFNLGEAIAFDLSGNTVVKFTKPAGSGQAEAAGVTVSTSTNAVTVDGKSITLNTVAPLELASNPVLGMWVHSDRAGTVVTLEVGDSVNGGWPNDVNFVATQAVTTKAGWQYLSFDFESPIVRYVADGNPNAAVPTATELQKGVTYDTLSVFFDLGQSKGSSQVYYFDQLGYHTTSPGEAPAEIPIEQAPAIPDGYVLSWSDEFGGEITTDDTTPEEIDFEIWYAETGRGPDEDGWGNGESQTYTNTIDNAYVQNGALHIVANKADADITSARLKSIPDVGPNSYVEVRAMVPVEQGSWPAIWLLGQDEWPDTGEIDIMEWSSAYFTKLENGVNVTQAAIHTTSSYGDTENKDQIELAKPVTEFQTYQVWWTDDYIRFGVNSNSDNAFYTYERPADSTNSDWPFTNPMDLILNLAIGGTLGGTVPDDEFTYQMMVDYVRVYSLQESMPVFSALDFTSGVNADVLGFEGAQASVIADPTQGAAAGNKVVKYTESATAKHYAGASLGENSEFAVDPIPFDVLAGETVISAKVWVDAAYGVGQVVRMQVADTTGTNDAHYVEAQATVTQHGWNTLMFDFSAPVERTVAAQNYQLVATGLDSGVTYDKISLFIDWENGLAWNDAPVGEPPTDARTYYIDDVTFVGAMPVFSALDFTSGVNADVLGFEGAQASVIADPTQGAAAGNKVVKYTESATAKHYAGASLGENSEFAVDPIPFDVLAGETVISAKVWVDAAYGVGQVVRMQVADTTGTNDAHYVEAQATVTQHGWNTLMFDFSAPVERTVAAQNYQLVATGLDSGVTYDKISLFIDWENGLAWNDAPVGEPPTDARTYYIDDVTFVGAMPVFSALDFTSGVNADVLGFEGAQASVIADPTQGAAAGNKVVKYTESATAKHYAGASLGENSEFAVDPIPFDVLAGETVISAKVWVDAAYGVGQVVRMQVADTTGTNDAHYVEAQATVTQHGWNTLMFDFSAPVERTVAAQNYQLVATGLDSGVTYDKISLFIDWENGLAWNDAPVGEPPTDARTYYIDDVTFVGAMPVFSALDFTSGVNADVLGFEGAQASVIADPTQGAAAGNKVVKYTESATAKHYAGASLGENSEFAVDPIPFDVLAGETVISAKVWVDAAYGVGQVVRMQVADTTGTNDAHYVEAQATVTQHGWNTLMFDFSAPVERTVAAQNYQLVATGLDSGVTYDKISLFIDWENGLAWNDAPVGEPPTDARTYYIDDVTFVGAMPVFSALDFTSGVNADVLGFEGAQASVIADPTQGAAAGNKVVKYTESATAKHYAGASLGENSEFAVDPIPFDVLAGETVISAKVWVDAAYGVGQVVRMQVADTTGTNDAHYVEAQATVTQHGWNTLMFDFSAPVERTVAAQNYQLVATGLDSGVTYDKISLFIDWENGLAWNDAPVGEPPTDARTYYIDDVTFGIFPV